MKVDPSTVLQAVLIACLTGGIPVAISTWADVRSLKTEVVGLRQDLTETRKLTGELLIALRVMEARGNENHPTRNYLPLTAGKP